MTKNDGGPALPVPYDCKADENLNPFLGMTLRDWFAGMALQGLISYAGGYLHSFPEEAYKFADAMLAERGKE